MRTSRSQIPDEALRCVAGSEILGPASVAMFSDLLFVQYLLRLLRKTNHRLERLHLCVPHKKYHKSSHLHVRSGAYHTYWYRECLSPAFLSDNPRNEIRLQDYYSLLLQRMIFGLLLQRAPQDSIYD